MAEQAPASGGGMDAGATLRLFAAIRIPETWVRALSSFRRGLEPVAGSEVKWVRPELMHLTLLFLGNQPVSSLSKIDSGLDAAAGRGRAMQLALGKAGSFGPPGSIGVIWAGLASVPRELTALHASVSEALRAEGIRFDERPLTPHVTIGRGRRPIDRGVSLHLHAAIGSAAFPPVPPATIDEFVLMSSVLGGPGPRYEVVSRYALGVAGGS